MGGNGIRDVNAGKSIAGTESQGPDGCDGVGDVNAGKSIAAIEGHITDVDDRIGDADARHSTAILERISTNAKRTLFNRDVCAVGHRSLIPIGYRPGIYKPIGLIVEPGSTIKRIVINVRDGATHGEVGQIGATIKSIAADRRD